MSLRNKEAKWKCEKLFHLGLLGMKMKMVQFNQSSLALPALHHITRKNRIWIFGRIFVIKVAASTRFGHHLNICSSRHRRGCSRAEILPTDSDVFLRISRLQCHVINRQFLSYLHIFIAA